MTAAALTPPPRGLVGPRGAACLLGVIVLAAGVPVALADEMENDAAYLPDLGGRQITVHNPLGAVTVHGWDRPQIRIIARKRGRSASMLARLKVRYVLMADGRLEVMTGFHLADQTFLPLPLDGAAVDLVIEAPRRMRVDAAAQGTIDAAGFRAGARLSSQSGEIRVSDLAGPVDTRAIEGRQWFESIRGSVLASGVIGDVHLDDVEGEAVEAQVFRGNIRVRDVIAAEVRLRTTQGAIFYLGSLRPDGRYQLVAHNGDVHLTLRPSPFRMVAHAPVLRSLFVLDERRVQPGGIVRGTYRGGGPSLELVSAHGEVVLDPAE